MYGDIYREMLAILKRQQGCTLRGLATALPPEYTMYTDASPEYLIHESALKLLEWGLAEAFLDGKPLPMKKLKQFGRWDFPEGITLYIAKTALEIEDLLGISFEASPTAIFGDHRRMRFRDYPQVFVVMPFSAEMKPIYEDHIRPAVQRLQLTVGRGDDFFTANQVMHDIWAAINYARVVIADCTGRNPNVFYEVGLCHAVGRDTVLVTQDLEDIPFDLRHLRTITYTYNPRGMKEFEDSLAKTVAALGSRKSGDNA
jgi:hypothetical protein